MLTVLLTRAISFYINARSADDVLVSVLATERSETPVGLNSTHRRIVGIVCVVNCTPQVRWYGSTKKNGVNAVVDGVSFILIECQQNEGPFVVESRVREERYEPVFKPSGGKVDIGVVGIVYHVRGKEDPLGNRRGVDINSKIVKVPNASSPSRDVHHGVIKNRWVVFAHVVGIRRSGSVEVVRRGEAVAKPP